MFFCIASIGKASCGLNSPLKCPMEAVHGNKIFVYGGMVSNSVRTNEFHQFDLEASMKLGKTILNACLSITYIM